MGLMGFKVRRGAMAIRERGKQLLRQEDEERTTKTQMNEGTNARLRQR